MRSLLVVWVPTSPEVVSLSADGDLPFEQSVDESFPRRRRQGGSKDPDDGIEAWDDALDEIESEAEIITIRFGDSRDEGPPSEGVVAPPETDSVGPGAEDPAPVRPDSYAGDGGPRRSTGRPSGLFGLAAGALSDATRFVAGSVRGGRGADHPELTRVLDTVVGLGNGVANAGATVAGRAGKLAKPLADLALHPPLVPARWHPAGVLDRLESAGRESRQVGEQDVVALAGELIPAILTAVLDQIDLTQLVLDRVDLASIIDAVDLDRIVDKIDLDRIVDKIDLDRIVDKIDLDRIVDKVNVAAVIAKVDVDGIVATVDLDKIISRLDINAVAATIDIDAIIDRVDLVGIADEVIDEIDLPRIIRQSSGSIASETVVGVRLTSASADDQVNRIMEKLRLRRRSTPEGDATVLQAPISPAPRRRRLLQPPAAAALPPGSGHGPASPTELAPEPPLIPAVTPSPTSPDPTRPPISGAP